MKKILIINANFYNEISNKLVKSSKIILKQNKIKISILTVPGIFEIPISIKRNIKKYDAFLALGCAIKGKTPHFDLICKSTFDAIMSISVTYGKPVGNGIITAYNRNQALKRSGRNNKGLEAAKAVLSILKNEPKRI